MKKNKKLKFISLIFLSLFVLFCQTIVYSAINATMSVRGDAYARAEADVRITDFRLATTTNATSSYEEFGKTHIVTEVDLLDTTSSITYYVEITNYGSVDVGVFNITGLPSGVNYSIKDYNLHDKICDENNKCNSFIKKTLELTLTTTGTYAGNVQLDFDFRTYHTVTYTDITNYNYQTEVIDGGNLNITFTETLKRVHVLSNGTELNYYGSISSGQTVTVNDVSNPIEFKSREASAFLVEGELDEVGSEVCIGEECFYVMSNDGSIVTMLAKYNLYVGGYMLNGVFTSYGEEATGIQDSTMLGYIKALGETKHGGAFFSDTAYWTNSNQYVYSELSLVYPYVEEYKKYLENKGAVIEKARLIKKEEFITIGCAETSSSITCDSAPEWVYEYHYWTGTSSGAESMYALSKSLLTSSPPSLLSYNLTGNNGVRPVIELSVDEIDPLVSIKSGDLDTVGSEVAIGNEHFYVISSTSDTVTMLAKYNLYVGGSYDQNTSTWTAYGNEATGKQDENMLGYGDDKTIYRGTTAFSNTNSTYAGSIVEGYVNNYKNILESEFGVTVEEARLITYDELTNPETFACNYTEPCSNKYPFVYSTSYWLASYYTSERVYVVEICMDNAMIAYNNYSSYISYGVRPVIIIPKWLFANTIEFTIDGTTYYAKEGMTWGEWVESEYNTAGFSKSDQMIHDPNAGYGFVYANEFVLISDAIDKSIAYSIKSAGNSRGSSD